MTHQHLDDLTVHGRTREDARRIMQEPIHLFSLASASEIQPLKAQGLEFGVPNPFVGNCPLTGIPFAAASEPIRHLGILLGRDTVLCRSSMYAAILRQKLLWDCNFYGTAKVELHYS